MIAYFIISVLYCATFVAFMEVNKTGTEYWNHYSWGSSDWKLEMTLLCILGFFFWPAVILFLVFNKIAFKILNKNKNTK